MKKLTKLTVALLTLVMVFSLCACGGASLEKDIVGTWKIEYDMGEVMAAEMGEDFADFDSSLEMTLLFDFTEDGEYKMYVDEETFEENFNAWLADFCAYSVDMMYEMYAEMDMSKEDVDALMEDEFGMSLEDYLLTSMEAEMDVEALMADMIVEGEYKVKGDKLFLSEDGEFDDDSYDVCSISGDTLKMETPDGDDEEILPGLGYPLEFERVD